MKVDCLTDLQKMVLESSDSNLWQRVGLENGEVRVETFDWGAFLGLHFKKLNGILKFQHICFTADGAMVNTTVEATFKEKFNSLTPELKKYVQTNWMDKIESWAGQPTKLSLL